MVAGQGAPGRGPAQVSGGDMGGGILNGMILGLVLSGIVLGAVSLSTPLPDRAPAPFAADTLPVAPTPAATPVTEDSATPDQAAPPAAPAEMASADPAPAPLPAADSAPAATPETTPTQAPETPVAPDPATTPPAPAELPRVTTLPRPSADPAPRLPRADIPPMASAPVPPGPTPAVDTAPDAAIPAEEPHAVIATPSEPPTPPDLATAPSPRFSTTFDASAGGATPRRLSVPEQQGAPVLGDATDPPPAPAATRTDEAGPAPVQPRRLPQVPPPPAAATATTSGLPQVLPEPAQGAAMPAADPDPAPDAAAVPPLSPSDRADALRDNAEPFEVAIGTPLMAVVLIDDPATPLDPAALADLSFLLTFAIDPTRPDAADRAEAFRAAGFEVVILAAPAIAQGATPADVETALAAAIDTIPQAVALMDDPSGRIQSDRPVLDATMAALGATGHGFLAFPQGLNAAEQTARRLGVPGTTFFRLLDDEDQRATVISRFLGRAAFDAAQTGSVIVAGRTRPDTVTGIFSWALANRVEGVALAPVSAVLQNLPE